MSEIVFLYVTYPSLEEVKKTIRTLIEERVIGCANIFPAHAMYRWEGAIVESDEYVAILKTTIEKEEMARERVAQLHSYDVPCIAKIVVDMNASYAEWISKEVVTS